MQRLKCKNVFGMRKRLNAAQKREKNAAKLTVKKAQLNESFTFPLMLPAQQLLTTLTNIMRATSLTLSKFHCILGRSRITKNEIEFLTYNLYIHFVCYLFPLADKSKKKLFILLI